MKFFSFKYYQLLNKQSSTLTKESTLYNGDISTALVNLYSINYSLDQIESFNWDYLKSLFSDQENERNSYITFLYKQNQIEQAAPQKIKLEGVQMPTLDLTYTNDIKEDLMDLFFNKEKQLNIN